MNFRELLLETKDGDWGVDEAKDGHSPFGVIRGTDFDEVRLMNISNVPIRFLDDKSSWRRTLRANDILFETAGGSPKRPTGRSVLITERVLALFNTKVTCASFARFLRVNPTLADPAYVYYFLQNLYRHGNIGQYQIQHTGVARFQFTMFADTFRIDPPSVDLQNAIAEVLGALDDKITASARLLEASDALIRAQWAAFSSIDHASLGDLAREVRVKADPAILDSRTPYLGLEHLPRRMMWASDVGSVAEVSSHKTAFERGDVLFGKLRPNFHKVVAAPSEGGVCSTDILVLRPKVVALAGFLLAAAASDPVVAASVSATKGTRMPRTSWDFIADLRVPWPGESVAYDFSRTVAVIGEACLQAVAEQTACTSMRDTLLPELMSGRLRVKDAEKQVEDVV